MHVGRTRIRSAGGCDRGGGVAAFVAGRAGTWWPVAVVVLLWLAAGVASWSRVPGPVPGALRALAVLGSVA